MPDRPFHLGKKTSVGLSDGPLYEIVTLDHEVLGFANSIAYGDRIVGALNDVDKEAHAKSHGLRAKEVLDLRELVKDLFDVLSAYAMMSEAEFAAKTDDVERLMVHYERARKLNVDLKELE